MRHRIKISKKEATESILWLKHLLTYDIAQHEEERLLLLQTANELMKIFAAVLRKLPD